MKIWGRINSVHVKKALWTAEELGLEYESVPAGWVFGAMDAKLNPNQRIPTLEDGDTVLWESHAIVRYLLAKYGDETLWDPDPAVRAQADKWMDWCHFFMVGPFRPLFWGVVRTDRAEWKSDEITANTAAVAEVLKIPEQVLQTQDWLSGERFGMGDIPLGAFAYLWFEMPIDRPAMPGLEAWYERLTQRPAYQKGVMTPIS